MITGKKYNSEHVSPPYDAIVIGSGMGGMTTAAILSRLGHKVLVLEQHYTAGGFTHTFKHKGYEFDVGLHYVGEVGQAFSPVRLLFDFITKKQLKWHRTDDLYDRFFFKQEMYEFVSGKSQFTDRMFHYFPDDKEAILQYLTLLDRVHNLSGPYFMERAMPFWLGSMFNLITEPLCKPYFEQTVKTVLDSLTSNQKLQSVLAGQMGTYGLPPLQSSFGIHALVASHFLEGAYFPIGGSSRIAETIQPVIEQSGGAMLTQAKVDRILVHNGRVRGVKLENGDEIEAKTVVSSIGIANTCRQLLAHESQQAYMNRILEKTSPACGHLCLFIGLKESAKSLGLKQTNLWLYPDYDHDLNYARALSEGPNSFPGLFISFPSTKDPEWEMRYPEKSTIQVISFAPFEWFQKWDHTSWRKRGDDYEALKQKLTEQMLSRLYQHVPQIKNKIDYMSLSTPLTTRHFCNYQKGEIYGLAHTPERFQQKELRAYTSIKGLFLSGQDIVACGIAGAMMTGAVTAAAMIGPLLTEKVFKKIGRLKPLALSD
ncbi:MAG: NAD(P)/FAD-dependent oxidoreductase [Candidatus Magnetomorum sp.]|nr:NAD(P)/FAD-dependent oxidoreductase [Candidatus Magnetomorum sp.]